LKPVGVTPGLLIQLLKKNANFHYYVNGKSSFVFAKIYKNNVGPGVVSLSLPVAKTSLVSMSLTAMIAALIWNCLLKPRVGGI